jgi:hypothetical protein
LIKPLWGPSKALFNKVTRPSINHLMSTSNLVKMLKIFLIFCITNPMASNRTWILVRGLTKTFWHLFNWQVVTLLHCILVDKMMRSLAHYDMEYTITPNNLTPLLRLVTPNICVQQVLLPFFELGNNSNIHQLYLEGDYKLVLYFLL